jgi:hypothetical protein
MSEHDPNVEEPKVAEPEVVEDLDVAEKESEAVKGGGGASMAGAGGDPTVAEPTIKNAWPKKYS